MSGNTSTIAKGMITLTSVSDAFSVLLSPASCSINSSSDGSSLDLQHAFTLIQVYRGEVSQSFTLTLKPNGKSHVDIAYSVTNNQDNSKLVQLTSIPSTISSGYIEFIVSVGQEYQTVVTFQFTVIRDSSMLDWIQDWNGTKTSIGGTYVITPKLFVGNKDANNLLNGVYIGPSNNNVFGAASAGIYGYIGSAEIFHLNESGGSIGGWSINSNGIISPTGSLKLLSAGSIISQDLNSNTLWGLYNNGEASFAAGNVQFHADGSASFAGTITASGGTIGGFNINQFGIYSSDSHIIIDSSQQYIGVAKVSNSSVVPNSAVNFHMAVIKVNGGVFMHYKSANEFGIEGYLPQTTVDGQNVSHQSFALGSTNQIAGWSFDDTSLYIGTKANILNSYATAGSITIGTNGLRGNNWYIDSDGGVSFLSGLVSFESNGGVISGWNISQRRIYKDSIALSSGSNNEEVGIYICDDNIASIQDGYLYRNITEGGGIYLIYGDYPELAGYTHNKGCVFKLVGNDDDVSQISSWYFDDAALYRGTKNNTANTFTNSTGSITIGSNGIRGKAWRLESDGSGGLANNKIRWTSSGDLTVDESVSVGKLATVPVDGDARIEISGSLMKIYGSLGVMNIKIGVDDAGHAILKYYDNDGNFLYDLGPNGLNWADVSAERFATATLVYIGNLVNSQEDHTGSNPPSISVLKIYYAKRMYGVIAGGTATNNNATLASEADGKYFTSETIVVNGAIANYANGKFRADTDRDIMSVNPASGNVQSEASLIGFETSQELEQYLIDAYGLPADNNFNWSGSYDSSRQAFILTKNIYFRPYFMITNGERMPDFNDFWQED